MPVEIVSRESELRSLYAFAEPPADGPAAIVLEGEAGIGKSTLWLAGVDHARSRGVRVISSRPAEAERGLAFAGLGDLLEDVLDDVLPALSVPRRRAMEVALLLEEEPEHAVDPRALGLATRDAFELLAAETPLLVGIDDVQWLDDASSAVLVFALRRLGATRMRLLLSRRVGDSQGRAELDGVLEPVERIVLGPLSVGALHRVLRDQLGRSFARQTLLRIEETSGGNPYYALELARVLDADGDTALPLRVPDTLDEVVRARISGLPANTLRALAFTAAHGPTSEALLGRAGFSFDDLGAALARGVIERENGTIRFTHPLLSSALYHDLGDQSASVHTAIAALVDDPIRRARHLALATDTPNAEVAAALDDAARTATARGARAAAAQLAEQALRLTPSDADDDRRRRALDAARAQRAAGEWTRAHTIATELLNEEERGQRRAEALVFLAELESVDQAASLLTEALAEASSDPTLQAEILCELASAMRFRQGFDATREYARRALELAEDVDDDRLRVSALLRLTWLGVTVGDPEARTHAARARELATSLGDDILLREATVAVVGFEDSHVNETRALLEREYAAWRERDEPWSAELLWGLAWVEFWSGRWDRAANHAASGRDVRVQYNLERPQDSIPVALVAAHRGQLELARLECERALALAEQQFGRRPPMLVAILGLVHLWRGNIAEGAAALDAAEREAAALSWGSAAQRWWTADHVEVSLELGRQDEALRLLEAWQTDAARFGHTRVLAAVTRCRGLLAAAEGDVSRASRLLEAAGEQHAAVGDPFGRARALLALGIVRRRARQKRPAREAIETALESFEQLGAATWVEKARGELGRIGGRTREEGLTAAERRVAVLVAGGRTNREVAAALFLGERTVASHLTHIYDKLGVRSRTELARRLRDEPGSPRKDQTF